MDALPGFLQAIIVDRFNPDNYQILADYLDDNNDPLLAQWVRFCIRQVRFPLPPTPHQFLMRLRKTIPQSGKRPRWITWGAYEVRWSGHNARVFWDNLYYGQGYIPDGRVVTVDEMPFQAQRCLAIVFAHRCLDAYSHTGKSFDEDLFDASIREMSRFLVSWLQTYENHAAPNTFAIRSVWRCLFALEHCLDLRQNRPLTKPPLIHYVNCEWLPRNLSHPLSRNLDNICQRMV